VLPARLTVRRHLSERDLWSAWLDGRLPAHLEGCETCRRDHADLVAFVETQRAAAIEEADGVFTPERLAAQKAHVLRRLENLAQPVRVLAFPSLRRNRPIVGRAGRRWVAMAAAAGLLIGLATGLLVNVHPSGPVRTTTFSRTGTDQPVVRETGVASTHLRGPQDRAQSDDAFLGELEAALGAPHVEELQAIDALTPRVREVTVSIR
jgi:anti-sigma factor RsiW